MEQKSLSRLFLYIIFIISGFAGLIYESIWSHYLKLFLGHAAYSQTLVLIIFMGGMAIGSWVAAQYSKKLANLLLYYAGAELCIGFCGLIFHGVFNFLITYSYHTVIPALASPLLITVYKWSLASLLILPQSILLGMTFPLMSTGIIRRFPDMSGNALAMLYFTNSIGASVGVLASGFYLIDQFGLPGTIFTAGLLNILVAFATWFTAQQSYNERDTQTLVDQDSQQLAQKFYRILLLAAALTGAASFLYEIGWIRLLVLVLGSTTHAFELMLSAFILGLALGGLWIHNRIDRLQNPIRFLGWVQVIMGILALSTLLFYAQMFKLMEFTMSAVAKSVAGYGLFNVFSHLIAILIMLPTTFCAGMTLPLLTNILLKKGYGEKSIGSIYAANTLGAITGIVLAVHVIMPVLGLKNVIFSGAVVDVILGIALLKWFTSWQNKHVKLGVVFGLGALLFTALFVQLNPLLMASGVFRHGLPLIPENTKILYMRAGKTATVTTYLTSNGLLGISTNGKPDASVQINNVNLLPGDETTQILAVVIPLSLKMDTRTAAMIGFGSGISSHVLLDMPTVQQLDTIEIEPAMVEGARFFTPYNDNAYKDVRSRIYYEDAKTFFSTYQKKYDLIISEPSNPWVSGVASLFSDEFYQHVKRHLTNDGILCQWMQLYELDMNGLSSMVKAVSRNFKNYVMYATDDNNILIIAKNSDDFSLPSKELFNYPAIVQQLKVIGIDNAVDLDLHLIGDKTILQPLVLSYDAPTNSDYYPYLDTHAARQRFLHNTAVDVVKLGYLLPLDMLSTNIPRFSAADISKGMRYTKATFARKAWSMQRLLTGHVLTKENAALTSIDLMMVANLVPNKQDCNQEATVEMWQESLLTIGVAVTPYLSEAEGNAMFDAIEQHACKAIMTSTSQQLLNLFKALNRRDSKNIILNSSQLLTSPFAQTDLNIGRMLLAYQILGYIHLGEYHAAKQVWDRFGSVLFKDNKPNEAVRLLVAITNYHLYLQEHGEIK